MANQNTAYSKILDCLINGQVLIIILASTIFLSGCGSKETEAIFVRDALDLNYVTKVALLPFESNVKDDLASPRIRDITATQVLALEIFDVVDKGVVDSNLKRMAIRNTASIDTPMLKILGQRLGVQAFLTGTVNTLELRGGRSGYSYPEVALSLQLIDSETSMVLWRTTSYRNGYSLINRLFDLDPQDGFEVTTDLIIGMLTTIPK